jgi:hypothetical protein
VTVLFQILWMAVILFSPLQQLTQRLSFVVLGVLTLVVLSEISKLNLHQYLRPARVSECALRTCTVHAEAWSSVLNAQVLISGISGVAGEVPAPERLVRTFGRSPRTM